MKTNTQHLFLSMLFAFLFGLMASPTQAAMSTTGTAIERQNASASHAFRHHEGNSKKRLGLFQRFKKFRQGQIGKLKALKKESEKASTMSKLALGLFLGSIALSYLISASTVYTPAISAILSIAFLASIVLSLIVLFSEENRKSKAIAKAILIISAVMIIIMLLIVAVVLVVLLGL